MLILEGSSKVLDKDIINRSSNINESLVHAKVSGTCNLENDTTKHAVGKSIKILYLIEDY